VGETRCIEDLSCLTTLKTLKEFAYRLSLSAAHITMRHTARQAADPRTGALNGGHMERKKINSSSIRSIGYDARNRVLEIEFSSGGISHYSGVAEEVYRRLMNAPSPGSYFHDNIEESFTAKRIR
jgi:hypothetical protein